MNNNQDIEKLFKETFEQFEGDVNPELWTNIQSNIHSPVASTGAAAGNAVVQTGIGIGKITTGIIFSGALIGSVWFFAAPDTETTPLLVPQNSGTPHTGVPYENYLLAENNSDAANQTGSFKNAPGFSFRNQKVSGENKNTTQDAGNFSSVPDTDSSGTGISDGSNIRHKYGKAPNRQRGLIRGSADSKSSSKSSSSENISAETPATETAPSASIFASAVSGNVPLEITFNNLGTGTSTMWDFGDGDFSSSTFTSHVFEKPGKYTVTLSVKNDSGTEAKDKVVIEVFPISAVHFVPMSYFSPNGDGSNDLFFVENKNLSSMSVIIMDRAGNKIYEWNTPDGKWDGKKLSGEDAEAGLYFYILKARGIDGEQYNKKGSVLLQR